MTITYTEAIVALVTAFPVTYLLSYTVSHAFHAAKYRMLERYSRSASDSLNPQGAHSED